MISFIMATLTEEGPGTQRWNTSSTCTLLVIVLARKRWWLPYRKWTAKNQIDHRVKTRDWKEITSMKS